jgi:hypothetical protein
MHYSKGMPKDDIGVFDVDTAVAHPFGNTFGGLARGLWDVAAGGMDLVIVV